MMRRVALAIASGSIWISAGALILLCAYHFAHAPTFWLDEAFVATSLKSPTASSIFAPLNYGQYFPRLYLSVIAILRTLFGFRIMVLRLLPSISFVAGTVTWAHLLGKRAGRSVTAIVTGAALLIGATYWTEQSIQLKQYTLDVALSLAPFILGDEFFERALGGGKGRLRLAALALPCMLSYTYPFSLLGRLAGWYIHRACRRRWRLNWKAVTGLAAALALTAGIMYAIDYRFNLKDWPAYWSYWKSSSLRYQLGNGDAPALIAKFLWGWYPHMPLVVAGIPFLQVLGVRKLVSELRITTKRPQVDENGEAAYASTALSTPAPTNPIEGGSWGSRSAGSMFVLCGVLLASTLIGYPISAGRIALFTQIHTQVLTLEGVLFLIAYLKPRDRRRLLLNGFTVILVFCACDAYLTRMTSPAAEDLAGVTALINTKDSNVVWVHPCSVAQVASLEAPLPVESVILGARGTTPRPGEKTWIVWTHLGDRYCRGNLARLKCKAREWRTVAEEADHGLALATF